MTTDGEHDEGSVVQVRAEAIHGGPSRDPDRTAHEPWIATFRGWVWLIAGGGLVLRLILGRFEALPPTKNIVADETWYTTVAHNVLKGNGFWTPLFHETALHGPLTVLLLLPAAVVQPHGYTAQRATMAVLGALAVVVIGYVGRELAGPRAGLLAAGLAAIYPGLWVNDLVATSETPAVLLLSAILLFVLRYRSHPATGKLVLLGICIGLLALDRAELALLAVLLVIPAIVAVARSTTESFATFARGLLVVAVLAVGVVVPWSAYNQARFHQTVLISNNLGATLVGANCPESYYGPLTGYDGRYCFIPVLKAAVKQLPKGSNEAADDVYFRHRAVVYATNHWHRWPVVAVMRELWLWSAWRPGWTVFMSGVYIGRARWIAWSQIVAFWLLTPLALYGFFVARRRRIRVAPLVTMVAFTAALGLLVVGHLRYRIPTEIAWVLLGAIGVDWLVGARGAPAAQASAPPGSVGGGELG